MAYFYSDRLKELQGMAKILMSDVDQLKSRADDQAAKETDRNMYKRSYVRAAFAAMEAILEQHRRLLLVLCEERHLELTDNVKQVLSQRVYYTSDGTKIEQKDQYLSLKIKPRLFYETAIKNVLKRSSKLDVGGKGWQSWTAAIEIRDRLTHPKKRADCDLNSDDLEKVNQAYSWFLKEKDVFVEAAKLHGEQKGWLRSPTSPT